MWCENLVFCFYGQEVMIVYLCGVRISYFVLGEEGAYDGLCGVRMSYFVYEQELMMVYVV